MRNQQESEIAHFRHFLGASGLPVVDDSIELRDPPEPDLRCQLKTGEFVAFELVEISNSTNARFAASAHKTHRLIMEAYDALPLPIRQAFDSRFRHVPLSFTFRHAAPRAAIKGLLPLLLTELVSMPVSDDVYSSFSPPVARIISKVREHGRPDDPDGVNFSLGGSFDPTVPLDALAAKLTKRYSTPHPIELLAHFGAWAWGKGSGHEQPILDLIANQGLGPFRRLWIQDWDGVSLVVPDDPRSAASHRLAVDHG